MRVAYKILNPNLTKLKALQKFFDKQDIYYSTSSCFYDWLTVPGAWQIGHKQLYLVVYGKSYHHFTFEGHIEPGVKVVLFDCRRQI